MRIGETLLVDLRQFDGQACLARVDEAITFHQSRVFGRREIFADKLPLSPSSEVVLAFHFQDSFQADAFHLFVGESPSVHGNHVEHIPSIPAHEACVGVVRDGAEHGPNHAFIEGERSVLHSVTKYHRYALPAHLDVVLMEFRLFGLPRNLVFVSKTPTVGFLCLNTMRHEGDTACQKNFQECFHSMMMSVLLFSHEFILASESLLEFETQVPQGLHPIE